MAEIEVQVLLLKLSWRFPQWSGVACAPGRYTGTPFIKVSSIMTDDHVQLVH